MEGDSLRILHICVLCITLLLGILGNAMVLAVVAFSRKLHNITAIFIINLAIGDLGITLFVIPFSIHVRITENWVFGDIWCQILAFLSILLYTISMSSLALVSVERLFAIKYPLQYAQKMKPTTVKWMVAAAWIYATLRASCPFLNFGEYYFSNAKAMCAPRYVGDVPYTMTVLVLGVLIPSVVMCYAYACIGKEAKILVGRGELVCNDEHCMYVPNRSKENKAAKILATITGIFFICWIPYTTANTWSSFAGSEMPYHVDSTTQWLTLFNSAINPWMHSLLNATFRKCAVKLWNRAKSKLVSENRIEPNVNTISTETAQPRNSLDQAVDPPQIEPQIEMQDMDNENHPQGT
ncbi:5-hydroxytryptamine receptor 4-like [Ptychodera flava]|uniref:5-hydroxytryptamine receptor 4-like n=1 Tax=Ptychodera flava TaxID=63121 RepID=UPI00396A97CB